ncbi:MAG: hypothetical protein [Caudoviricetes sp.]|nr:MAG: hypothetical protein [Caudoviricetes sp.]
MKGNVNKVNKSPVFLDVTTETIEGVVIIKASAEFLTSDMGWSTAESTREIDLAKADELSKSVSLEQFIEATKRDALRELVTQLNLHKVL